MSFLLPCPFCGPRPVDEYACFGEVTRGLDVAYTIAEVTTGEKDKPIDEVVITDIRLRPH